MPRPENGTSCPVTLILGDDIGPLVPRAVQQVMELAPLFQDLVTGDAQRSLTLCSIRPCSASRVRRNNEIRMVQVRHMRREVGQLLDGNQNKDGMNQGKAETEFSLVARVV